MRWISVFVLLAAFWAVLSFEVLHPYLATSGLVTCGLVAWVVLKRDLAIVDWQAVTFARALLVYLPWLLLQILQANLRVIRVVWHPALPIDPRLVEVPCSLRTGTGKAVYAHSITLTPGTVTVDVGKKHLLVHALTAQDEQDLLAGDMERKVLALEPRP